MDKFRRDLETLINRIKNSVDKSVLEKLMEIKEGLIQLHYERLVKINHSVMELLCAADLLTKGYGVIVEHPLDGVSHATYTDIRETEHSS